MSEKPKNQPDNDNQAQSGLAALIAERRAKLAHWQTQGDAFPNDFRPDCRAAALHQQYQETDDDALAAAAVCSLAGRIMLKRVMGKASFMTLQDASGKIQIYLRQDALGEAAYSAFKSCDLGDLVGISGGMMRTRKGELTMAADSFRLLVKALRPLPDKHHGLSDRETIARQRYLDLLLNGTHRVHARARMNQLIREFLAERNYLEVETPMMHPIPGGANALPFITHHNSLARNLYLRVAPELYLKRLLVGGLERVYELNRNFRNEGVSTRHNPEFTMLECYCAWEDWHQGMGITEQMLHHLAISLTASDELPYGDETLSLQLPFKRQSMVEAVAEKLGVEPKQVCDHEALKKLAQLALSAHDEAAQHPHQAAPKEHDWQIWDDWGQTLLELFEKLVEPNLHQPIFITHFPVSISPLARTCTDAPDDVGGEHQLSERWELLIGGREIAGGFSELNNPEEQAERFRLQSDRKEKGDSEAMHYDEQFIEALEYGMPPASGVGIGLDRLLMLLTDSPSVRDVILFPQLRDSSN